MAPWKKFLLKSADFGKFEKEEKQKYKQYVKIEKQNARLRSKPEAEIYEDSFFSRLKSLRRSSKKRSKTPAPPVIENAYEIIEGQPSSNNVVVINDDLRSRFSGYELPKLQDNIYVVVQPQETQVEKPKRLRWKKSLPTPPQNEVPSNHGKHKEKTKPKSKPAEEALRVPEDDPQDTSMSEVYYDCEDYVEIPSRTPSETLKESREPSNHNKTTGFPTHSRTVDVPPNLPHPSNDSISETSLNLPLHPRNFSYDSTSDASLTRSYDVEYAEYEELYDSQRIYNRYSGEEVGPEDESRWQPSNVRFCEMSGDEDEQQIYGPFGTFEVTDYENTLNSRIQMVLENERHAVMLSLEDQRAADEVDGVEGEKLFEFADGGTHVQTNEEDFGAVDGLEKEREVEAKNVALIEAIEEAKTDAQRLQESTFSGLPVEVHEEINSSNVHHEILGEPLEGKNVAHQLRASSPFNLYEEIFKEIQKLEDVEHHESVPISSELPNNNDNIIKRKEKDDGTEQKETATFPPQVSPPLQKGFQEDGGEIPQVEAETKKGAHLSSSSFRLIDNYSSFLKDPMSMMAPRSNLRSSFKVEQHVPEANEDVQREEDDFEYENLQFKPSRSNEKSPPPSWKESVDPKSTEMPPLSLRTSSKAEEDNLKPNGTALGKEDGVAYKNLEFKSSMRELPLANLRSSTKVEEANPEPNATIQGKEDGVAYQNLQFKPSMDKEESTKMQQSSLRFFPKVQHGDLKFDETMRQDTYENLQFNQPPSRKESPLHLKKSRRDVQSHYKNPVAQPRLSLFTRIRSRVRRQNENDFVTTGNTEERKNAKSDEESGPENATSDLFNGLPVEPEEFGGRRIVLSNQTDKEDRNERGWKESRDKNANSGLYNGLQVESEKDKLKTEKVDANTNGNLRIPWETKPKNDADSFTYFSTWREEEVRGETFEVAWNASPKTSATIENSSAFSTKGENQNEFSEIKLNVPPNNEDTSVFHNDLEEEEIPLEIPWGTRPEMSLINKDIFAFFGEIHEDEPKKSKQEIAALNANVPDASHDVQNKVGGLEYVNVDWNSETPEDNKNSMVFLNTRPQNSEKNRSSSGFSNFNFNDDVITFRNDTISSNEISFNLNNPEKQGQNNPGDELSFQNIRDEDIRSPFKEMSSFLDEPTDIKEVQRDNFEKSRDLKHEGTFCDEETRLNQDTLGFETEKSKCEDLVVGLERNCSVKQKTWHVGLLQKYEIPGLRGRESEAEAKHEDEKAKVVEANLPQVIITEGNQKIHSDFTTVVDGHEIQNEATILEDNYRLLRGFNVAKEEGVVYHNLSDPPQRPFKKTKLPKKVSFRITETPESPDAYFPAHSPTEVDRHIKKSAKLEAITRKLEKTASLKHSISLNEPTEKPKPNFSTFPRNAGRVQNLPKSDDLERLRIILSGINDLVSVHEQVRAMEDVSSNLKDRVDKFDASGSGNEYSELLQIMYRSVRIVTVLECGFDPILLDRQQTVLDEIRNSMAVLNSK